MCNEITISQEVVLLLVARPDPRKLLVHGPEFVLHPVYAGPDWGHLGVLEEQRHVDGRGGYQQGAVVLPARKKRMEEPKRYERRRNRIYDEIDAR